MDKCRIKMRFIIMETLEYGCDVVLCVEMGALKLMCLNGCIEIHPYRDIIPDGIDGVVLF